MNHLVFLDTLARELETILSGVKTMLTKEFDPAQPPINTVNPGDTLYFLRDKDDCTVRVKATVVRVLNLTADAGGDLSHTLKEFQPRLQLTEDQYNTWSGKHHVLLVEFESAQKTSVTQVTPPHISNQPKWIAFEEFSQVT